MKKISMMSKETKLVQTTGTQLNAKSNMETLLPYMHKGVKLRNLANSRLIHSFTVTSGYLTG